MKKKIVVVVAIVILLSLSLSLIACGDKNSKNASLNIVVPDGAPALAVAQMLSEKNFEGYNINYEIVAGATDIAAKIASGAADIAIMPTNIAARLYNTSAADIKLIAANVFGLLYIVGTENITSINQLRGEKILCTGQGGTPDFVLQYILSQNGIVGEDLNIEYIYQGSDAIAALQQRTAKFAVLGEPAATMAVNKANATVLFDLQEEWEKLTGYSGYPQAGTVVTSNIFSNHVTFLKQFLKAMSENATWITEADNTVKINDALKAYNSTSSFASKSVIERCNIRYEDAISAKDNIKNYFGIMKAFNPAFIGGEIPNEGFFAKVALD